MRIRKYILLAIALLLCSCSGAEPAEPQSPLAGRSVNYETTANITYRELEATATISQTTPECCRVTFSKPDTIAGMELTFQRDSVGVAYKGLEFQFDPDSVPGGAVADLAVRAINRAMQDNGVALSITEGGVELRGVLEVGEFTLRLDSETGNLLKLSVPSEELEIEFANFQFLD